MEFGSSACVCVCLHVRSHMQNAWTIAQIIWQAGPSLAPSCSKKHGHVIIFRMFMLPFSLHQRRVASRFGLCGASKRLASDTTCLLRLFVACWLCCLLVQASFTIDPREIRHSVGVVLSCSRQGHSQGMNY